MAGFGGSAALSLLTGLARGYNEHEERKREEARKGLSEEYTRQQIDESKERVSRLRRQEAENRRIAQETAAREAEEAAQEAQRRETVAGMIVRANPTMSPEEANALIDVVPPTVLSDYLNPEDAEELNRLEALRAEDLALRNEQRRQEMDVEAQMTRLRNSPEGLRIRRAVLDGDEEELEIAVTAATGHPTDPVATQEAVLAYIDEVQPKNQDGTIRLTPEQRARAASDGRAMAESLVMQNGGSVERALINVKNDLANQQPDNPFDIELAAEVVKQLETLLKQQRKEEGSSVEDELEQRMIERLRGGSE